MQGPASQADQCDLVMKGGITSGVVYQGTVLALTNRYRFRNVGGASAGAIAAAVTAAAQYGELVHPERGGFARLQEVTDYLKEPEAVADLFQPPADARPVLDLLIAFVTGQRPVRQRLLELSSAVLAWSGLGALVVVLGSAWIGLLAYSGPGIIGGTGPARAGVLFWVLVGLTPLLLAVLYALALLGAFALLVRVFVRTVRDNGFGLCSGLSTGERPALTQWLHARIQRCAGLAEEDPSEVLTFARLAEQDIHFQTVTTDLSAGRPVRLPLDSDGQYLYDPTDMAARFPPAIVSYLETASSETPFASVGGRPLRLLPGAELPILVAARLSLSFPLLLSAIRLYSLAPPEPGSLLARCPVESWFTDGGASSNFPIHFFDSWFPARPTFGLDLQGHRAGEPFVYMPESPLEPVPPRFRSVAGLGGFLVALADAVRNWRDTLQSELAGYRERICHIRLDESEGGLNLNMPPEVVDGLVRRGREAGEQMLARFDWNQHRLTRYLTFMEMMERNLRAVGEEERFPSWRATLARGRFEGYAYAEGHDPGWWPSAAAETGDLLDAAEHWGAGGTAGFETGHEPQPTPVMRITPQV